MSFELEVASRCERGPRERLEDYAAVVEPKGREAQAGVIAALADGVSTGGGGLEAAQAAVLTVTGDYHAAPLAWDTSVTLERLIGSFNAWLTDHNRRRQPFRDSPIGMTTLTTLVLRGHGYSLAHVGDSRAWLVRQGDCIQLTQDHTMGGQEFQNGLTRALGAEDAVRVDHSEGDIQIGDTFILTSDGVHGALRPKVFRELARLSTAQAVCDGLVDKALAAGTRDNASALVIRIKGLAEAELADAQRRSRLLPVPERLQAGDTLDGLSVLAQVANNGVHRVAKVLRLSDGRLLALKTLHPSRASDPEERAMLAHEAWLGARVTERDARGLVRSHEPDQPTAFYTLQDWCDGQPLGALIRDKKFDTSEVVHGAIEIARAVGRLHQHGVVHRDIKPDNLLLGEDGQWHLLDLGVALSGKEPECLRSLHAGTPSYMNPEQWSDDSQASRATAGSDLFALGVVLYEWLTGRLPYGEVEPYQMGRYRRDPVPPSRLRPDVPIWLDHIVFKAVARDPRHRFETAEELVLALERGASRPLMAPGSTPLVQRDPAAVWKMALGVSLLFNLLLVYWLMFLPSRGG